MIGCFIGRDHLIVAFSSEPPEKKLPDNVIDHGKQRHGHQHADQPPQPAEEQDGKGDPETGDAGRTPDDPGPNHVAVQLLQDQDENHEHQAVHRVGQQQDQRAGNGADERPHKGDDIGDADHDAEQRRLGEAHHQAAQEAEHADDGRIQQLAQQEAVEDVVDEMNLLLHLGQPSVRADTVQRQPGLRREALAGRQQIYGHDQAQQDILDRDGKAGHIGRGAGQHGADHGHQPGLTPGGDGAGNLGEDPVPPLPEVRLVRQPLVDLLPGGIDLPRQGVHDADQAPDHLRHQDRRQQRHDRDGHDQGDGNGKALAGLLSPAAGALLKKPVQRVAGRRQQIRQRAADNERAQDGRHLIPGAAHLVQLVDQKIAQNPGGNHKKGGNTRFDINFIFFQPHPLFPLFRTAVICLFFFCHDMTKSDGCPAVFC